MRKGKRGQAAKEERELSKQFRKAVEEKNQPEIERLVAALAPLPKQLAPRVEKPEKVCALESCTRTHTHNNRYCCAEHCKQDRVAA